MSNSTRNLERSLLLGEVAQSIGDYFILLGKHNEAKDEYLEASAAYDEALCLSPDLAQAKNNKEIVRSLIDSLSMQGTTQPEFQGEESRTQSDESFAALEPLSMEVLLTNGFKKVVPGKILVRLGQWLKNDFTEAVKNGWQTIEEVFGNTQNRLLFGTRSGFPSESIVKRAKGYELTTLQGVNYQVALLITFSSKSDDKVRILIQVRPFGKTTQLPFNIKLALLSEEGRIQREVELKDQNKLIQIPEFTIPNATRFSIQISLENFRITEDFIVD